MQPIASDHQHFSVVTDEIADTLASTTLADTLVLRVFSMRCREARVSEAKLINQDYAQVHVLRDGSSLSFCVCDGVGSSYRGDMAARYLGSKIVEWLQTLDVMQIAAHQMKASLYTQLEEWKHEAQRQLLAYDPPNDTPVLVREVLEELRTTYGSETVFLAGRIINAPWATDLQRSHPTEAFFCWMGNVTARLFVAADQSITLGGEEAQEGGWSTVRGICGPLALWRISLTTLQRILIHTDGMNAIAHTLPDLDDTALQAAAQKLLRLPESDDMTMLDMHWLRDDTAKRGG